MPQRYFNWKLAIVLVIGLAVLGGTAVGLRGWRWQQRVSRAKEGLKLGNKAYEERRWDEAAKQLGRYIAVEQDDVSALLKYADAHLNIRPFKKGGITQATQAYRIVLRIEDSNSIAAARLTELYLNLPGMAGEAELIASRYLEKNKNPKLQRLLAIALYRQRKFALAATKLKSIIAEHPDQVLAYETLGLFTEQRPQDFTDPNQDFTDPNPAIHWYDEAVKNNPSSALAYIVRAGFHLRNKDQAKALTDLNKAAILDLSDHKTRLRLAAGYISADALDKAEQHLTAVQRATPADQALWKIWVQLALKSQSQEKMLKIAETGLKELSPQPWDFLPLATDLFIRCNRLERAQDCISKLRSKDITPATVAFLEGYIADKKHNPSEAVKCWKKAIQLGNKSSQIRLVLASALSRLGDIQSAQQQLRILVSEQPYSLDGHLALARLLAQTGNWAEVAEQARIASQIPPNNLGAFLLRFQAEILLLATSPTGENTQMWQYIEKQLSELEKTTDGALEVRLLQLQVAMQQKDLAGAEKLVTELKETYSSELKVILAEVSLLSAKKQENKAISLLNETIKKFPESVKPVVSLVFLLDQQNDHEKCEKILKDAMKRIEQPAAQRRLGLTLAGLYIRWGRSDNVYPLLNELAQKLPNDIPIKRGLLSVLLSSEPVNKDAEKTQQLVNDIKLLEGEDGWQWRYEQARVWFNADDFKNRYPQIILLLDENLLANPDNQASRLLLAVTYEKNGDMQIALSTYRQTLSRSPQDTRVIIATVAALYRAEEDDEASDILNRASREKLYHPALQELQLMNYLQSDQLSLASNMLEDSLNSDPNNIAAGLLLANIQIQQKKYVEAGELLDKLSTQEPNSLLITKAQILLNVLQNKPQEALKLCDKIISKLNNASSYVLRAKTLVSLQQTDKAIEDFERAVTIEPNNVGIWIAKSSFYNSIGQTDKAIKYFEYAVTIEPNNVGIWVAKSDFYYLIGQPDKAISDIQRALSLDPNNLSIRKNIISLLITSSDSDKVKRAKAMLDNSLESNPEDSTLLLFKAQSLVAEKTAPAIENARQILQKITRNQPKTSRAWLMLGEISLMQVQPGKAIDAALRGLAHTPNEKTLLLLKARAEAVRSPAQAIPTFKVLRSLDPNNTDTAVFLANAYIDADEPEKAVNLMQKQLTVCETAEHRKCNTALAKALYKNDKKTEAQKIFDSLLRDMPDNPNPLFVQVQLLVQEKLWDQVKQKAVDWFQKHPQDTKIQITIAEFLTAIEHADAESRKTAEGILRMVINDHSDSADAIRVLAILLQTTNRNQEAAKLYQRVLTLQPDNVIAMNNLAWIMCEEEGKFQEALELAERGLKIEPQYIDLIDTRGAVYYRLNKFNEAIRDFTTCIKLYPNGTPAVTASHFHLGRALAKLGQKDKAIEHLRKALNLENQTGGLSTTNLSEVQRLLENL